MLNTHTDWWKGKLTTLGKWTIAEKQLLRNRATLVEMTATLDRDKKTIFQILVQFPKLLFNALDRNLIASSSNHRKVLNRLFCQGVLRQNYLFKKGNYKRSEYHFCLSQLFAKLYKACFQVIDIQLLLFGLLSTSS